MSEVSDSQLGTENIAEKSLSDRINILGVGIHATNPEEAVHLAINYDKRMKNKYICVSGVHGIMEAQQSELLRSVFNQSYLTVPDGVPTVWIGKAKGYHGIKRVYGPDFMISIMQASAALGKTHFLYGGNVGVAEDLKRALELRIPGVKIVGTFTPPFRELSFEEQVKLQAQVDHCRPDFFWVGISTPKQDLFMGTYANRLNVGLMIGVGAAFDIHTGRTKDAPDWIKRIGMQWFHRLCQEPRRLWRRYLIYNPWFLWKLFWQALGLKQYSLNESSKNKFN